MARFTNDEIEITLHKKDKIYLSLIFVLLICVVLIAVYVPRYYHNKYTQGAEGNTKPSTENSGNENDSEDTSTTAGEVEIYKNSEIAAIVKMLADIGGIYSNYSNYLTENLAINGAVLKITETEFNVINTYANSILDILNDNYNTEILTEDILISDDEIMSLVMDIDNFIVSLTE